MDANDTRWEEPLADLLQRTAEAAVPIRALEQGRETPHDDQIEGSAHEFGQRLSGMAQSSRPGEVAADQPPRPEGPDEIVAAVTSDVFRRRSDDAKEVREMLIAGSELSAKLPQTLKQIAEANRSARRISGNVCEIRLSNSGDAWSGNATIGSNVRCALVPPMG